MGRDRTVLRACDSCGKTYSAVARRVKFGWSLCCSKSCANRLRKIPKRRKVVDPLYVKLDSRSEFKNSVRASFGGICSSCGKTPEANGRQMDVHRILPDGLGGKYEAGNCIPLCRSCHAIADRKVLK